MSFGSDMAGGCFQFVPGWVWVAIVLLLGAGFLTGFRVAASRYETEALEHGYAQYNPTNGVWQWKKGGAE